MMDVNGDVPMTDSAAGNAAEGLCLQAQPCARHAGVHFFGLDGKLITKYTGAVRDTGSSSGSASLS